MRALLKVRLPVMCFLADMLMKHLANHRQCVSCTIKPSQFALPFACIPFVCLTLIMIQCLLFYYSWEKET